MAGPAGKPTPETAPDRALTSGRPLPVGKPLANPSSYAPVTRPTSGPAANQSDGPGEDPKVKAFVAAAKPLIARYGGLQGALAELRKLSAEMGLQPAQLRAVESLLSPPLIAASKPGYTIARRAEGDQEIVWMDETAAAPPAPPPIVPVIAAAPVNSGDRLAWFQERALSIIAENRGFGPKTQMMLAQAATELGLSPVEREIAIHSLREPRAVASLPAPGSAPATTVSNVAASAQIATTSDQPAAEPREQEPLKPAVAFRAAAASDLAKVVGARLNRKERRAIINRGVAEFRISEPFARKIVDEVAAERGLVIEEKRENGRALEGLASGIGKKTPPAEKAEQPLSEKAEAFLARARQILAEHRGLNSKSRVFLNAAAANLDLPQAEIEPLVARLQQSRERKAESEDDTLLREQLDGFRQWLDVRLARLELKLVTASVQRRFMAAAEDQHGLSGEQGRAILTELAAKHELLFITAEQAIKHLAERVQETLHESAQGGAPYDSEARYRLVAEAEQWGLDAQEAEDLVDEQIALHKAEKRRRAKLNRRLIGAAVCVVGLVASGLIAAVIATRDKPDAKLATSGAAASSEGGDKGVSRSATSGGKGGGAKAAGEDTSWWDPELALAMGSAKNTLPDFAPLLAKTRSRSADERLAAYRQLVDRAAEASLSSGPVSTAKAEQRRHDLEEIIAGCHALDPSDACAAALAEAIVERIPSASTPLPTDAVTIRQAFWACGASAEAIVRLDSSSARGDALARMVSRAVGLSIDRGLGPIELAQFIQGAVTATLYRKLAAEYASQPAAVKRLEPVLAAEAALRLDREALPRYQADYLAAVIPSLGADWRGFQDSLSRCVESRDPLVVLKIADACEKATNDELKEFLLDELLMRVGHYKGVASAEEALAIVRENLGASDRMAPIAEADRLLAFSTSAEKALGAKLVSAGSPGEQLARVVELAHLNSLGCALARQDAGRATFDELLRVGPPKLKGGRSLGSDDEAVGSLDDGGEMGDSPLSFTAAREDEDADDEKEPPLRASKPRAPRKLSDPMRRYYLNELSNAIDSSRSPAERSRDLASTLPRVSRELEDLDQRSATAVAEYLALRKSEQEHQAVLDVIDSFAKWKTLKLVLADNIEAIRLAEDQLLPIVSGLTGREIAGGVSARKQAREALMQSVIDDLSGESKPRSAADAAPAFDEAREALRSLYVEQAKVSGVGSSDYLAATTPAQIMRLLILSQTDASHPLQSRLKEETAAIDYLAADDLSRTVLLQRLWLRVCVAELAGAQSEKAAEAEKIVAALAEADRSPASGLGQLVEGETALLKVWMLWSRPKA